MLRIECYPVMAGMRVTIAGSALDAFPAIPAGPGKVWSGTALVEDVEAVGIENALLQAIKDMARMDPELLEYAYR